MIKCAIIFGMVFISSTDERQVHNASHFSSFDYRGCGWKGNQRCLYGSMAGYAEIRLGKIPESYPTDIEDVLMRCEAEAVSGQGLDVTEARHETGSE